MKKLFEDAEFELIRFGKSDIIVTSPGIEETDGNSGEPEVDDEFIDL